MECASNETLFSRTSIFYRSTSFFHSLLLILSIIFSIKALHLLIHRSVFAKSTTQILIMALIFAMTHAILYGIILTWSLYRSFRFSDQPCSIMFSSEECFFLTFFTASAKLAMVFVQCTITIDTILNLFPLIKTSVFRGVVFNAVTVVVSIVSSWGMYRNGPSDSILPNCLQQHSIPLRIVIIILSIYFILSLMCLIVNILLINISGRSRKNSFNLSENFFAQMVRNSSLAVCVMSVAQFVTISGYVIGSFAVFALDKFIPTSYYSPILIFVYTIPFAGVTLPISIIRCISSIAGKRKAKIELMRNADKNEIQQGHFQHLDNIWQFRR